MNTGTGSNAVPRIVLTRQKDQNRPWVKQLEAAGAPVLDLPLLSFEPLPLETKAKEVKPDWILFTSPRGVLAFVAAGLSCEGCQIGALGAGTSATLKEQGLGDDLGFAGRDGTELAAAFVREVSAPASVLLPGPARRMPDPRATLEAAGFQVQELPLYRTVPVQPKGSLQPDDIIFFCSPSAVRAFVAAFEERPLCVAIGETTAPVCRELGFETRVAENPDLQSMVRAAGVGPITISPEIES